MEQIDVLGYYAKKFTRLNNVVILAIMNKPEDETRLWFDKSVKGDKIKFRDYLQITNLFNSKEMEEILKNF